MPAQDLAEDSAPTRHAVRVDWFRREPGGGTIFVVPTRGEGTTPRPVTERNDVGGATYDS